MAEKQYTDPSFQKPAKQVKLAMPFEKGSDLPTNRDYVTNIKRSTLNRTDKLNLKGINNG